MSKLNYIKEFNNGNYNIYIKNKQKYVNIQTLSGIKKLKLDNTFDVDYVIKKLKEYNTEKCNETTVEKWLEQKRREKYKVMYNRGIQVI